MGIQKIESLEQDDHCTIKNKRNYIFITLETM